VTSTRELFDRATTAFNAHDRARLADLTADNCVASGPGGMQAKGKQECVRFTEVWLNAFPDAHTEVNRVYIDGDVAIDEGIFTGTHKGVFSTPTGDIPATQRKVAGEYVGVNEFRNGKLVRQNLIFDRMQLMEQLGLAPTPVGAGRSHS
jgi:predicted ester cyclase